MHSIYMSTHSTKPKPSHTPVITSETKEVDISRSNHRHSWSHRTRHQRTSPITCRNDSRPCGPSSQTPEAVIPRTHIPSRWWPHPSKRLLSPGPTEVVTSPVPVTTTVVGTCRPGTQGLPTWTRTLARRRPPRPQRSPPYRTGPTKKPWTSRTHPHVVKTRPPSSNGSHHPDQSA